MTAREDAFQATPRGRLLMALSEMVQTGGYEPEASASITLYRECLGHGRVDVIGVARIIKILSPINVSDARVAVEALADMLLEEAQ